jgi:hypothetical protein
MGDGEEGYLDKWSGLLDHLYDKETLDERKSLSTEIAMDAARRMESDGNDEDAVALYHIGGDYGKVLGLLCQQIVDAMAGPLSLVSSMVAGQPVPGQGVGLGLGSHAISKAEGLLDQTGAIVRYYQQQLVGSEWIQSSMFYWMVGRIEVLRGLLNMLKAVDEAKWHAAIHAMVSCKLFTFEEGILNEGIWKVTDQVLSRHIPLIFVLGMRALFGAFQQAVQQKTRGESPEEYKKMAKQMMLMIGRCVALRMPADIYAKISQYESFMNI